MRKILELVVFILPVLILIGIVYVLLNGEMLPNLPQKAAKPTIVSQRLKTSENSFDYYFVVFDNLTKLRLIDNENQSAASKVFADNGCIAGINGGFYGKDNEPLGFLVSDGIEVAKEQKSDLLNGYIWLSDLGGFGITQSLPESKFELALNTGPLLYLEGNLQQLEIVADKMARRSIIGTLSDNSLFFLTVFDSQSVYLGPKLSELPKTLEQIAEKEGWQIIEAINLDGGTASAYKDQDNSLWEFKPVRSVFCLTE